MKKISIYSLIIGMGAGIVITSIFNIVYIQLQDTYSEDKEFTFQQPYNKHTYISDDIINPENYSNENNLEVDKKIDNNINNEEYNEILISQGMQSEEIADLLETKGIIKSSQEFNNVAAKLKMTKKIQYGLKIIPSNSSLDEILLILTKK